LLAARTANLYVTGQEKIDRDVSSTGAYRDTACFARMSPAVLPTGITLFHHFSVW